MSLRTPHLIPKIHLLLLSPTAVTAFHAAQKKHLDPLNLPKGVVDVAIHECSLSQLEASVKFDAIVSPANSAAILDGAFDDALSRALSPRGDYFALTRLAQGKVHEQWRGFAPPGSCTLVDLPQAWTERSKNVWGASTLALSPTMRVPGDVKWDREVVYECVWSLLNAVYNRNRETGGEGMGMVRSVCMTPLATGAGVVPEGRWAEQFYLALKHFIDAVDGGAERGEGKQRVGWPEAYRKADEVAATWKGDATEARREELARESSST